MRSYVILLCLLSSLFSAAQTSVDEIYVDEKGVMRWTGSGAEASFYGVNYTLPFAHAYRAVGYINKKHKEAIDKDVYHFARMGFNAYRIHVWDVEISDAEGRLIENDHLDLLDYLLSKLQERNIRVLLTTMTNFGNGYPEKNINTGGFSYLYDKCNIHRDKKAISIQENYVAQFVKHINPYTQKAYKDDPYIIGFEINNEPCHAGEPDETEDYINSLLRSIESTGNKKPVFYNVSHNMYQLQAYYNTAIQGTTFQWYPIGLVAGQTREGNFLPYVDNYSIPFDTIAGFANKAKAVYEFDPADITYSYMYPAMTRSFRSGGFQWITQFAYDPIDIAWANTEYQTHFLNLAYTPGKAVSMAIAAEAAYTIPRNEKYPNYPNDTLFGNFQVSYKQDLSVLNSPEKFYYSNHTATKPVDPDRLEKIIGCGSSPVVGYEGTGAYFLDRLEDGVWRLEVMPDAIQISDPFAKPSLKKEVVTIASNEWDMEIRLPGLGENFTATAINKGNTSHSVSSGVSLSVQPGVYLLKKAGCTAAGDWRSETRWNTILLGEFVAPEAHARTFSVVHQPKKTVESGHPIQIQAQIVGPSFPDSVIIYTDKISFWSDFNPYIKMERAHGYTYTAEMPESLAGEGLLRYNMIVCYGDKKYTFPQNAEGSPLDWDFYVTDYWETQIVSPDRRIELFRVTDEYSAIDSYGIPETSYSKRVLDDSTDGKTLRFSFVKKDDDALFFWRKQIKSDVENRRDALEKARYLCLAINAINGSGQLKAGFVTSDGFTYTSTFTVNEDMTVCRIALSELKQDRTALLPAPYPMFLERYFVPDVLIPFDVKNMELLEISTSGSPAEGMTINLKNCWLE